MQTSVWLFVNLNLITSINDFIACERGKAQRSMTHPILRYCILHSLCIDVCNLSLCSFARVIVRVKARVGIKNRV